MISRRAFPSLLAATALQATDWPQWRGPRRDGVSTEAGLLRAIVITSPQKPLLEAVARGYSGPVDLEFVSQDRPRGLGDAVLGARDHLTGAPFAVLLPDNLFQGPNPTSAILSAHRRTGLATVLLAGVSREDAASSGATGRARVETGTDGSLLVVEIADKGKGRFDTGGSARAVTPV